MLTEKRAHQVLVWNNCSDFFTLRMAVVCIPVMVVSFPHTDTLSETSTDVASEPEEGMEGMDGSQLVVKSTFLDDGQSLMQRYRKLRRAKTDFTFGSDPEVYEPGKFSTATTQDEGETSQTSPLTSTSQPTSLGAKKERTTVMLRNLPNNYTREMFLQLLDDQGFKGRYDFAYLPCDFYRDANLGYAFVNLVDSKAVDDLWKIFHGFSDWALPTSKVCEVRWSGPHQGFKAHVERYRNSPVMHKSVPDEYKPVMFQNGVRKPFPKPTKKVKAPF